MAGLQRFITYIHRYKNNEKMENAGFAKIEIRSGICRMEVHIRNVSIEQPEATIYLFAESRNIMQAVPVGNFTSVRGAWDVRCAFDMKELADFGMKMGDMEGIYIPFGEEGFLASRWKEGGILGKEFWIAEKRNDESLKEPVLPEPKADLKAEQEVPKKTEKAESEQTKEEREKAEPEQTKEEREKGVSEKNGDEIPEETIRATELPEEEFFAEAGWEKIFQKFRLKLNICFPFEGKAIECVRMQLNDLKEFPQKYWYIGNNSFLLHGFFNYRHIIFGKMEEAGNIKYFIGVPGVFQNQERIMASMFGFPEFRTARHTEYKTGNFGYWYRII